MPSPLIAPAAGACAFALGCALIHAARAHARVVTRLLAAAAVVLGVLVLLAASLTYEQDEADAPDPVSAYAASG